ncbi:MAG: glycosyltransferase, partial [Candidatus Muiribacteriaceae bacterium]
QINWLTDNFVVYHQFGMHEENRGTCEEKAKELSGSRYTGQAFFTQEQLLKIYSLSPVVLGRAGAGTINDIACFGLSSVLVPLESSAGGEQKSNAEFLLSNGAALVVHQKEFDSKKAKQALLNAYVTREKTGMNISALLEFDIKTINKILDFYL